MTFTITPAEVRSVFIETMAAIEQLANPSRVDFSQINPSVPRAMGFGAKGPELAYRGLYIVAFNTFDEFISNISRSYMSLDSTLNSQFDNLPDKLRNELLSTQLQAFSSRLKFERTAAGGKLDDAAKVDIALELVRTVRPTDRGTLGGGMDYSFLPSNYDIGIEDIKRYLACFGAKERDLNAVIDNWNPHLASSGAFVNFRSIREKRNSAAHSNSGAINNVELITAVNQLTDIGAAFEILVADFCYKVKAGGRLDSPFQLKCNIYDYDKSGAFHRIKTADQTRALARNKDYSECVKRLLTRPNNEISLIRDDRSRLIDWVVWADIG